MDAALKALGEPRRRHILALVGARELAAGEIHRAVGGVTFGAVSQHLRVLREAGLVAERRDGRRRLYRARPEPLAILRTWLDALWADALHDLKSLAESEDPASDPAGDPSP